MVNKPEIVVVGSHAPGLFVRVRRVPQPGETVIGWDYQEPVDGGKGSNQAIAAARLGRRVRFAGCLGKDRLGDQAVERMQEAGVDTSCVRRSANTATGAGFIMLDPEGVPAMVTAMGANAELSRADVDRALQDCGRGQILLTQFEIPLEVALYAAQAAHARGLLTVVNPAPASEAPLRDLDYVDILTPNESEARQLLGLPVEAPLNPAELAQQLRLVCGAGCVIVTLGEQGIAGADGGTGSPGGSWVVKPPPAVAVDTSGAGDVFCAALACGLLPGQPVRQASAWACRTATLSTTRPGTIPSFPSLAEVEAFVG